MDCGASSLLQAQDWVIVRALQSLYLIPSRLEPKEARSYRDVETYLLRASAHHTLQMWKGGGDTFVTELVLQSVQVRLGRFVRTSIVAQPTQRTWRGVCGTTAVTNTTQYGPHTHLSEHLSGISPGFFWI